MSERIVSALAEMKQLYLESVYNNDPKEKQLQEEMRQVYEFKKPQLDPVGKEDEDVDNDEDKDKTDDYLLNRRGVRTSAIESNRLSKEILKAIKNWKGEPGTHNSQESAANVEKIMKSIQGLRPPVAESTYYSWRDTVDESVIWEILDNEEEQKQVKENSKINNYSKKNPVVTVNPEFNTESSIIDSEELTEEFVDAAIDIASQYFYEEGLNEDGIQILMDELGAEEFYEWVMEIGYETLLYEEEKAKQLTMFKLAKTNAERAQGFGGAYSTKKPLTGAAATARFKSSPEVEKTTKLKPRPQYPGRPASSGQLSIDFEKKKEQPPAPTKPTSTSGRRHRKHGRVLPGARPTSKPSRPEALDAAKQQQQPASQTSKEGIKSAIRGVAKDFGELARRERAAREATKKGGIAAGLRSFFLKPEYHENFELWVNDLLDEGYDLSEYTWDDLYEEFEIIQEKAVSEQQQKIFGLALSVKRGETPRSQVSDEVLKIVDSMSEKEIRKYAKTPHKDVPKTVDESYLVEKVINFVRENRL